MNSSVGLQGAPIALPYESYVAQMLGWNIPAEHIELVHSHWRGYEAPSKYWHYWFAFMYFCIMIMSCLGNGIVLWIFATTKSLRTPSNMFVVNQALLDLLMMIEMPMFVLNSLFYQRPIGWEMGCDIYALLGAVSGIGSAINNAAIAYDRYRTISFPLDGRLQFGHALAFIVGVWSWAMPFSLLPLLKVWGRYVPEGLLTTCSFDYLTDDEDTKVFTASIFTWSYAFPLCLIVFFYCKLFKQVRLHEKMLQEQARKMNVKSLQTNQDVAQKSVEIRIAKVAFTIFFLFLCSWTPYATVAMIGAFGNRALLTPMSTMIPALFSKIVSCIDPWIYAINHPRFRGELLKRAPWFGVEELKSSDVSSIGTDRTTATAAIETPAA
uniref:Blue-sensitive opsin n=1 Tax=Dianemobius nigrofasciatus TaxID=209010 RepID=A2A265_9ORTH|nr:blue-sensitive opsin precursor [Dianemobius nigrofasciatus]